MTKKKPSQKQLDSWAKQSQERKGKSRHGEAQTEDFHRMVRRGSQALFIAIADAHPERVRPPAGILRYGE